MSSKDKKNAVRAEQVQRIARARRAFGVAQRAGTQPERARTSAVLNALIRTSTPEEHQAGYAVDLHWPWNKQ